MPRPRPQPHPMKPEYRGVWRLPTEDVRFVGWFPKKNIFIVARIDSKAACLEPGRDEQLLMETVTWLTDLDMENGALLNKTLEELSHVG